MSIRDDKIGRILGWIAVSLLTFAAIAFAVSAIAKEIQ